MGEMNNVMKKDITVLKAPPLQVTYPNHMMDWEVSNDKLVLYVSSNKRVDRTTVIPSSNFIVRMPKDTNAAGRIRWISPKKLKWTSTRDFRDLIIPKDCDFFLTIKDSVKGWRDVELDGDKDNIPGNRKGKGGSLKRSFYKLKKTAAAGIDKVTFEEYEKDLDENVEYLLSRMKTMSYRPQAARRTYIPKGNGKWRPLGIPTIEDKMVQRAMTEILESVYEQDFLDFSYGFRPGRSCHQALSVLDHTLMRQPVNYVIDADIKGFFDNVNHSALRRCIEKRITDKKFIRYILRFLKSGIVEEGELMKTEIGTPQGGSVSPILASEFISILEF